MIKIKDRVDVRPSFVEAIVDVAKRRYANIREGAEYAINAYHNNPKHVYGRYAIELGSLKGWLQSRSQLDAEITKFRALPYRYLEAREVDGVLQFIGVTKDITMVCVRESRSRGYKVGDEWDIGQYMISISAEDLYHKSNNRIHCIPLRNPRVHTRTPHHIAPFSDSSEENTNLRNTAYTCWASFGGIIGGAMSAFLVSEFWNAMKVYVERFDAGSPLSDPRNMDFARRIK